MRIRIRRSQPLNLVLISLATEDVDSWNMIRALSCLATVSDDGCCRF